MTITLVKKWLTSDGRFSSIVLNSKEAEWPISKAMIGLSTYSGSNYNESKERELAQSILNNNQKYDKDLFILFLLIWSGAAIRSGNYHEANMLTNRIKEYKIKIPELQVKLINLLSILESVKGDEKQKEKYLLEAIEKIPKTSAHYELTLLVYMTYLSDEGRLKDFEKFNFKFKNKRSKLLTTEIIFRNYIQTCQFKNHSVLFKSLDFEDESIKKILDYKNLIRDYKIVTFSMDIDHQDYNINSKNIDASTRWYIINCYLKEKDPVNGLAWAKKFATEHKAILKVNNTIFYTLIRAELSNKNISAASKLLNEIKNSGYIHYLNVFFDARFELLKGNKTKAEKLFKKCYEYCLYYNALNRLYFELDLSSELPKRTIIQLLKQNIKSKPKPFEFPQILKNHKTELPTNIIGQSKPMIQLKNIINKYANADTSILIYGETGVGKEEVAHRLHNISDRSDHPFLVINCAAIAESLLHSELFGHLKGSYTGATQDHKGIFEAAKNGTVFLDEIGDISEHVQVSLLRILESNEVKPIGSTKPKKIKCRIITATNKNLKELVNQNKFREDLYYRLNRLEIQIPTLKERNKDIILLAELFLKRERTDKEQPKLSKELQKEMMGYSWPGNVRQLKNEMDKLRLYHSEKLFYDTIDLQLNKKKEIKKPIDQKAKHVISENTQNTTQLNSTIQSKPSNDSFKSLIENIITNEKTPLRRLEKIRAMFKEVKTLTRGEIIKVLNVAPGTITTDLKLLVEEGYINRVTPSASTRTHYFQLKE
ncbi:MAG: hypothetical protein COA79_07440 [Planctomycetota bacterium]|nr:MAG: hypothetical protein COA79_07440 [Planctomycetota bacterium]